MSQTPLAPVTASSVRITPWTIQGWRPTSVTIQPHSIATIAAIPETATARRNHGVFGMSVRRHQTNPNQAPSAISAVPIPTIVSNDQCSMVLAGGRSFGGYRVEAGHLRVGTEADQERVEARGSRSPP